MSTLEARELAHARDQLRDHAARLLDPQAAEIQREDGTTTRHVGPSLMAQLRAAVATGREVTLGQRGAGGRPLVIDTAAHDLLAEITAHVALWPWCTRGPVDDRIRATVHHLCGTTELTAIRHVSRHLAQWAAEIPAVLTPERRRHLASPCPACTARMAWVRDPGTGERVQVPALQVHTTPTPERALQCTCLACGALWPETHFALLAQVLT